MNFILAKKLAKTSVPVLVGADARSVERHPFVILLSQGDRAHLRVALRGMQVKPTTARVLTLPSGRRVFVTGISAPLRHRHAIILMRRMVVAARAERIAELEVHLGDFIVKKNVPEDSAELLAMQCELANFEFTRYKTPPPDGFFFVKKIALHASQGGSKGIEVALQRGKIIGEEINSARALSNTPAGDMVPATVARAAEQAGKRYGFRTKILNEKDIAHLKMGGVLGVAKGSAEKPKFIVMEYLHGPKSEKPVVLVGKGVTFDSGGLNVKPGDYMNEMHMDMSGGAAVIHTIAALARLKVKKNIVGLVPAVENMPSGSSYRPGDVLTTMSGKTIEVGNTDAEGRVILADALTYAKRYDPKIVIDIATLTGAAEVALGQRASALFATDEKVSREMIASGEAMGDYVWPLPLWEEYEDDIKGTFGDVSNTGKTRYGGAITGAVFLWQFVKSVKEVRKEVGENKRKEEIPWVHLDIAPRMTSIDGDYLAKGAAGASIALITHFLRQS